MLVKCELKSGGYKIIAMECEVWEDVLDKLQFNTFKWIKSLGLKDLNIVSSVPKYLESLGIKSVSTLTFDEEKKIVERLNLDIKPIYEFDPIDLIADELKVTTDKEILGAKQMQKDAELKSDIEKASRQFQGCLTDIFNNLMDKRQEDDKVKEYKQFLSKFHESGHISDAEYKKALERVKEGI